MATTTLYRPVGPAELALIAASGWRSFPPRLPEQPIFYPVLTEEYAAQIAERWNVRESGAGYVTAFDVDAQYVATFEVKQVGGREHLELWVPAEELPTFNQHIVGVIRVVREFAEPQQLTFLGTIVASSERPLDLQRWVALVSTHASLAAFEPKQGMNPFTKKPHTYRPHPGAARLVVQGRDVGLLYWAEDGSNQVVVESYGDPEAVAHLVEEIALQLGAQFVPQPV